MIDVIQKEEAIAMLQRMGVSVHRGKPNEESVGVHEDSPAIIAAALKLCRTVAVYASIDHLVHQGHKSRKEGADELIRHLAETRRDMKQWRSVQTGNSDVHYVSQMLEWHLTRTMQLYQVAPQSRYH